MSKEILLLASALCLGSLQAPAQVPHPPAAAAHRSVPTAPPITEQWDFSSSKGRIYRIFVTRSGGLAPSTGLPVLYALDGNAFGPLLAAEARLESGHEIDTNYLIVAVGYATDEPYDSVQRQRDYTIPWRNTARAASEHVDPARSGEADTFLRFLLEELRPEIQKRYPVDLQRQTLFGHSLGGLFVLHALFTHPGSFQHYIAASPSVWWDGRAILQEEAQFASSPSQTPDQTLLLSVGEFEQTLSPSESRKPGADLRLAHLEQRRMVGNIRELAGILASKSAGTHLQTQLLEVPAEGHMSSTPAVTSKALQIAFAMNLPEQEHDKGPVDRLPLN